MDAADESGRPSKKRASEAQVARAEGLKVRPLWLNVSPQERYLLLEDMDTGDVLLPLIYMKSMFEANYSRKLSSLKHRIVALPERFSGERPRGFVYWQWAFESPHEVKVLVRKMLGEENTPQGHLRLILLPIVFNAMAQKAKLRESAFFKKMEKAVRASTYWPLLKIPIAESDGDRYPSPLVKSDNTDVAAWKSGDEKKALIKAGSGGSAEGAGTSNMGEESNVQKPLFHGPYDLHRTIAKYCLSYEAVEAVEARKSGKLMESVLPNQQYEEDSTAYNTLEVIKEQNDQLKGDIAHLRLEYSRQTMNLNMQLQELKDNFASLIARLDKGSAPAPQSNSSLGQGINRQYSQDQQTGHKDNLLQQLESARMANQRPGQPGGQSEFELRLGPSNWGSASRVDDSLIFGDLIKRDNAPVPDLTQNLGQNLTQQPSWPSVTPLSNTQSTTSAVQSSSSRLPHWLAQNGRVSNEQMARFSVDSSTLQNLQNSHSTGQGLQQLLGMHFAQQPPQ